MRALDSAAQDVAMPASLQGIPFNELKPYLSTLVWQMYDNNKNQPVFNIRKWFISITVTVEQIRPLLEQWFGPHP